MPKLKKAACSAISSARSAARGSSIMVPTRYSSVPAPLLADLGRDGVDPLLDQLQLARRQTNGIMISGTTVSPLRLPATVERGLEDGARLHLVDLGEQDAEPAAAQAQHRVGFLEVGQAAAHQP